MQSVVLHWYAEHARPLPWRTGETTAWGILLSEVMAHQTQVQRAAAAWSDWIARWPTPADLAAASPAEALRMWDRLGYPRRALWLHAAAQRITAQHDGRVPTDEVALRALPGVGEYTAAAVLAFAYGQRIAVLDVNVRRVYARLFAGEAGPTGGITNNEREHATALLPPEPAQAALYSQAVMEFGALVCTARSPRCDDCPLAAQCAWLQAGRPAGEARRRQAKFAGSDRQCRGAILAVVRAAVDPVPRSSLEAAWQDALRRERCLDSLLGDGLRAEHPDGSFALPA